MATLVETLQRINWHYGKGEIKRVDLLARIVYIRVPVTQNNGYVAMRKFTTKGRFVTFLGHKRKFSPCVPALPAYATS